MNKIFIMLCLATCNSLVINTMHRIPLSPEQLQKLDKGAREYLADQKATYVATVGQTIHYLDRYGCNQNRNIKELQKPEFYFFTCPISGVMCSRNDTKKIENNGRLREELTEKEWHSYLENC